MRKFFIKVLCLVIGIGLIFNRLGTLADRTAPLEDWRVEYQERFANLEARRTRIEAVTLGNSHSDSIDYSVLGLEGQSLAFAAADLFEVEKYATYLVDTLPRLNTVFITISYYSFRRDNAAFEPLRTRRIRFYSMVPVWSPIQGDGFNFLLGRLESLTHVMSVVRSDSWQGIWKELAIHGPPENPFPYDGIRTTSAWGDCFHYPPEQLETHAWEIANRNISSSNVMAAAHPGLERAAFEALARTIEQLQSKGIRVILFTPTYYEKYNQYFSEGGAFTLDGLYDMVDKLQQSFQVEYYDFSDDSEFEGQPELFYNSDHLGDCGQRVFSAKLLEAMNIHPEK